MLMGSFIDYIDLVGSISNSVILELSFDIFSKKESSFN